MSDKPVHHLQEKLTRHAGNLTRLALAMLAMLVLGFLTLLMVDLGRMLHFYSQLSNGVREGARFGSVIGVDPQHPQFANCAGIRRAVKREAKGSLIDIDVRYDDGMDPVHAAANRPLSCDLAMNPALLRHGDRIVVTARADFYFLTPFLSRSGPIDLQLTAARTLLLGIANAPH